MAPHSYYLAATYAKEKLERYRREAAIARMGETPQRRNRQQQSRTVHVLCPEARQRDKSALGDSGDGSVATAREGEDLCC